MAGGDLGSGEEVAAAENATASETKSGLDTSALYNLTPKGNSNVTVNDYQPANDGETGALNVTDYYPTLNQMTSVNTSGSIIGSHTYNSAPFALAPLGMMDARDAAIHKAALQKQMEEADFMKRYQSPTTTHVAVQPELTKNFYNFLQNSIDDARRKYPKNPYAYLNSNVEFNRVNKNFQDLSKFHDAIVDHAAKLDLADKDPNMVILPETKKAGADLLSGVAYKGMDPFSEQAADIGKKYMGAKSMMDLDVGINQAVAKNLPAIENTPTEWKNVGTEKVREQLEHTYFPPEKQAQIAHDFAMQSGWDEPTVLKHLQAIQNEQIKRHVDKVNNLFPEPKEKKESDYSNLNSNDKSFNYTNTREVTNSKGEKTTASYTNNSPLIGSYNFQQKEQAIPISIAITSDMGNLNGTNNNFNTKQGSLTINANSFGVGYRNQNTGEWLSKEDVEKKKADGTLYTIPGINAKAIALGSIVKTTEDGEVTKTGDEAHVPLHLLKDKYTAKGLPEKMNEVENLAASETEKIKQAQLQQKSNIKITNQPSYNIKGQKYTLQQLKDMGYTEEQVSKYKK
jgi:hypothetical protein